ncbi:6-pyruvoyl-tetrahydropterin synthase [Rubrobacter radiotolerans]|uniref:6-carboxy-5,6,7,8-tetrahydropterin synthase n=1 Tax=Rubrobacter radiotolerans TaxID=42256 RepID=A0A023X4X8_RUBRA|nr:6-carboxytetrahydropterin synthase [Rubrobacter radiotolerans]AHY47403.1 6-pyruvoyl-tetrahydropterin synthase [Rubrobacter radiotolerans]MDX5894806.1 6-carboxytetrahydropterin synthase [Rubrobacter radiotolerans]SMC06800.1 6-pyruvoyltetrahydropterin/6-carboxytetrahydropterin synthase [Rubrobacter radiotolerans DSM 5868]
MYEVLVAESFEAAHRLVGDFGPATRVHGHTYRVEVAVRGERLGDDGTLYDLGKLGENVKGLAAELHYRNLDEVEGLAGKNTTAEAVADFVWERLAKTLAGSGLSSLTVRVWENPNACAAREDRLPG